MGQMILEFVRNVGDLRETFKNEKERKEKFEYHMLMQDLYRLIYVDLIESYWWVGGVGWCWGGLSQNLVKPSS